MKPQSVQAEVVDEPGQGVRTVALLRILGWAMVAAIFFFLFNNYMVYWQGWPGLGTFFGYQQWLGLELGSGLSAQAVTQGWTLFGLVIVIGVTLLLYVLMTPRQGLHADAERFTAIANYLIRACFWAVLAVGVVDTVISFLRVEDLLAPLVGEELAKQLGRPSYRGVFVHYPLVGLGFFVALFSRGLGFIWLAFLVVIAEFSIVISRFVFSYEQVFMGDLVRFWYAALFLFASAYALVTEGHVRVDVFYAHFSNQKKAWANTLGSLFLGLPLCWVILVTGTWSKGSSLISPMLSYEIYQQGYGMYVKYLMVGFLLIFAVSMGIQFISYFLENSAKILHQPSGTSTEEAPTV